MKVFLPEEENTCG